MAINRERGKAGSSALEELSVEEDLRMGFWTGKRRDEVRCIWKYTYVGSFCCY